MWYLFRNSFKEFSNDYFHSGVWLEEVLSGIPSEIALDSSRPLKDYFSEISPMMLAEFLSTYSQQ